jgi:hypothetical protein
MRESYSEVVEAGRIRNGDFATAAGDRQGAFFLRAPTGAKLKILASDASEWPQHFLEIEGPAWEHVSVSALGRTPTWEEMAWIKGLFFSDEECVIQFHPPRACYVNYHPFCLHLWRPVGVEIPLPPMEAVGPSRKQT